MKRKLDSHFLGELVAKLSEIPKLATAVLYGSAARGELTERSDVDLLLVFDIPHNPETSSELEEAHRVLGKIKTERRLQIVATNTRNSLDPDFWGNVCREGIVIYGKPLVVDAGKLRLRPYVLFTYSVAGLPQVMKSQLQRTLRGYRVEKLFRGKKYVSEKKGLLERVGAKKMGKGVVMVPQEASSEFEEVLKMHGAKYQKLRIWH